MRQSRLLIATHNRGKTEEIARLLDGLGYDLLSLADFDPSFAAPDEIFDSFAENALLKAHYYFNLAGCLTLADDSGLVVDALGGAPGVYSARYAGPGASQEEMIAKLITELDGIPRKQRRARFVCAVAIVGHGLEQVFEGSCEGTIILHPRGSSGFGYDPVFLDEETGKTFAELTSEEKSARSHRGRALAQARDFLAGLEVR